MSQKYLFLFTIGPVQSFILQARKTQDLYAGSKLLSDLTKHAIQQCHEWPTVEIRFPSDIKGDSLPNRFLAEIEIDDNHQTMYEFGKRIEDAVRHQFIDIAEKIFKNQGITEVKGADWQLQNHLDIFWVFESLSNQTYREAFHNIESNLASIKNFRTFQQIPEYEKHRKCSISGEYDALFFGEKVHKFANKNAVSIKEKNHLFLPNEGLSSISFIKRFYKYKDSFPSTAEICALNILDVLKDDKELIEYKEMYNGKFDSQLLYSENINPSYFYKHGLISLLGTDEETIANLKENRLLVEVLRDLVNDKLKPFSDALKKVKKQYQPKGQKLKSYYAVIMIDTDNMGKWLTKETNDLRAYHSSLSLSLAAFTKKAKEYLDDKKGKTIYAGGDDFIGLVNLDNLFDVLKKFNELFKIGVSDKILGESSAEKITFSAGIAIAHYKEPLGEVMKRTRQMESKAKKQPGKAAFAIGIMKHSGEIAGFVRKWGDQSKNLIDLELILNILEEKNTSPAFITNLERTFDGFDFSKYPENFDPMFTTECKRLIKRASRPKQSKDNIYKLHNAIVDIQVDQGYKGCMDVLDTIDFIYRKS